MRSREYHGKTLLALDSQVLPVRYAVGVLNSVESTHLDLVGRYPRLLTYLASFRERRVWI